MQSFWTEVYLDIIEPLPPRRDQAKKFIFLLTDCYSHFPVAKVHQSKKLEDVAQFLYEWILVFGCFQTLATELDAAFISLIMEKLKEILNARDRIPVRPKKKRSDPKMKKKIVELVLKKEFWEDDLDNKLFELRNLKIRSKSSKTPYEMVFGRGMNGWLLRDGSTVQTDYELSYTSYTSEDQLDESQ